MFSQYPFFPCPLLLCIAFSSWAWARGARKHQKHFSSRLTLSIEFFKVPCRSSLLYTPLHSTTELHSSSCSVAVSSSIVLGSFYLSVLSSIFRKRFTSFTKSYCSFSLFEAVFLSFSVNWCLSQLSSSSSSHKFNFCCYAPNLAFYNHASRMRNEVQVR